MLGFRGSQHQSQSGRVLKDENHKTLKRQGIQTTDAVVAVLDIQVDVNIAARHLKCHILLFCYVLIINDLIMSTLCVRLRLP